jgi:very-short-patch-repair endonuclease/DNA polymerase III delta prime subunit
MKRDELQEIRTFRDTSNRSSTDGSAVGRAVVDPSTEESDRRVVIHCIAAEKLNFACHQNHYAVLRDLRIENLDEKRPLENLIVTAESDPAFLKPKNWHVDRVDPKGTVAIRLRDLDLNGQFLLDLTEAVRGTLKIRVERNGESLGEYSRPIELLAPNEWGGAGYMPELLAAFCMPNDPAVDRIIHDAANVLRRARKTDIIDGYQSRSRKRVWEIAGAIYAAVANLGISYATPPASFETNGQKIRLPSQILEGRVATCLDTALLLAAAFEQAGLNPIVALLKDHALAGVWLQPEKLASVTNDEAEVLRKRFPLNELVLIESTFATLQPALPFSRAVQRAMDQLTPDNEDNFVTAVDIARARAHQISPLGLRTGRGESTDTREGVIESKLALEEAPALPDFDEEVEEERPETPEGRIERWQRKLLDLSARNPLLNHRLTKSSISIFCPDPDLLEDKLAAGSKISIVPVPRAESNEQDRELYLQRTGDEIDEAYARDALEQRQILVDLPKGELEKRLVEIYRKAQTSLQEGGANTLYLAIGFLLWKRDAKDERRFRAPLILVPVTLQRQSVRSGVKMLAHDDEPRFNTTLLEMLRKDFGIEIAGLEGPLPSDASGVDVREVWNRVRRAIVDSPGFEVVEDVVLGHFSFAKYLMWKDLVDRTDDLRKNPVVRHLIDTPRDPYRSSIGFVDRNEVDRRFRPSDFLTPLPADSSQMAAIATADQGKDFIIIGPPGTGKSQTISNLIAHLLGKGKTVLFVSEKTAALNVVYRRLHDIGLGRFCLELHSNKARKADVLNQLKESWDAGLARTEEAWEEVANRLEELRDRLNQVVHHLHRKHRNGMTAHRAMGIKVRDEAIGQRVRFVWVSKDQHSEEDLKRIREVVRLLQVQARAVGSLIDSPFRLISHGEWSPSWEHALLGCATRLAGAARQADVACRALCSSIGIDLPQHDLRRLVALGDLGDTLKQAYRKQAAYALEADGQDRIEALERAVSHLKAYAAAQAELSCPYDPMAWRNLDGEDLLTRWKEAEGFWVLRRMLVQRAIRKELREGGAKGKPNPPADAAVLIRLRKEGEAIDRLDRQLAALRDWEAHTTDPKSIEDLRVLGLRIRTSVGRLVESPQALVEVRGKLHALLEGGNDLLAPDAPVGRAAGEFQGALSHLTDALAAFEAKAGGPVRELLAKADYTLDRIRGMAESIVQERAGLNHWCAWQRRRNEALDLDLGPLVEAIESGAVPLDEIPETFEAAYAAWWSERVVDEDEVLRTFSSAEHSDTIENFRQIDDAFLITTARYIAAKLSAGLPSQNDVPQSSQWGVIKREITRRARHKPVRQLMQEAPDAIMRLAPCLMMSPLSVAQYLSPKQSLFDVVIFDEASQITVWDAVGSIARGKQVIVAGDPKQMPPTNFFTRSEDDVDGDIDYEGDLESILDELRSANIPELTLNLHYRSRRESLIAFSNNRYYDNKLVTFPAPERAERGVRLVRPRGFYDRGKSRTNEEEARAIVAEVVRRLTSTNPEVRNQTIGVVSFNSEQQSLIQDLLDCERSRNPDIEWAFAEDRTEPVFVKNLETVQGDERDVILFSVTYGPDRAGHVSMNFGPLNREGGERRLNVAMTRGRSEMVVFSTLHPDQIDLSRSGARAVADLKQFLEYAEKGPSVLGAAVQGSLRDFESPFEAAVASGLREKGWTVHPQIGVSAFRVDLGVVHPNRPGVYLAGVECDGAMYHSSAYARERDKIRQAVLEGLGWTLFRVWSTDWWINKGQALENLDQKLRAHLEAERTGGRKQESVAKPDSDHGYGQGRESGSPFNSPSATAGRDADPSAHPGREKEPSKRRVATFGGREAVAKTHGTDSSGGAGRIARSDAPLPNPAPNQTVRRTRPYVRATITIAVGEKPLGVINPSQLVDSIRQIVEVESPVHVEDVIRRVTQAAGLQRAGSRVQNVVKRAIRIAEKRQMLRRKGDFLWSLERKPVVVRDRSEFPQQEKKLERVAPEEIARAFLEVVQRNFSISASEAVSEAANDLGFQRVTARMHRQFARVLDALTSKGLVQRDGDSLRT